MAYAIVAVHNDNYQDLARRISKQLSLGLSYKVELISGRTIEAGDNDFISIILDADKWGYVRDLLILAAGNTLPSAFEGFLRAFGADLYNVLKEKIKNSKTEDEVDAIANAADLSRYSGRYITIGFPIDEDKADSEIEPSNRIAYNGYLDYESISIIADEASYIADRVKSEMKSGAYHIDLNRDRSVRIIFGDNKNIIVKMKSLDGRDIVIDSRDRKK